MSFFFFLWLAHTLHLTNCHRPGICIYIAGVALTDCRGAPNRTKCKFLHNVTLKGWITPKPKISIFLPLRLLFSCELQSFGLSVFSSMELDCAQLKAPIKNIWKLNSNLTAKQEIMTNLRTRVHVSFCCKEAFVRWEEKKHCRCINILTAGAVWSTLKLGGLQSDTSEQGGRMWVHDTILRRFQMRWMLSLRPERRWRHQHLFEKLRALQSEALGATKQERRRALKKRRWALHLFSGHTLPPHWEQRKKDTAAR